ncbi:MAG: globin domain-containing protein [Pseudomonadota bacterium]|nr:globin domain-containing protein [Pseudomonadota bacterium]
MKKQGQMLMSMLNTSVNGLDNLETLVQPLKNMGVRHTSYGVKSEDYDKVGDAFLWTLNEGLGDAFTDEVKDAWATVYTVVADTMKAGAAEPAIAKDEITTAASKHSWWQRTFF